MGLIRNIFGSGNKNKSKFPLLTTTDLHSHLIPGIDDGVKTMSEAIELISEFKRQGYSKLITTPHIMSDYFKNTPEIIRNGLADVKKELKNQNIDIELEVAAEYYIDENFLKMIGKEELLWFGQKYVLVETNPINYTDIIRTVFFEMRLAGYQPVLAHPERYSYFARNFDQFQKIKDMEVFLQINLISLADFYSTEIRMVTEKLVKENLVDFVGSDAHEWRYMEALDQAQFSNSIEKLEKANLLNKTL